MPPLVTSPKPSPTSSRIPVGLRTIHRAPRPARVLGCGTLGFLEMLQAPVPLPSGWTGARPGLPAGDEKALGSGAGMGEWGLSPARQRDEQSLNKSLTGLDGEFLEQTSEIMDGGEQGRELRVSGRATPSFSCTAQLSPTSGPVIIWGEEAQLGDPLPRGPLILA